MSVFNLIGKIGKKGQVFQYKHNGVTVIGSYIRLNNFYGLTTHIAVSLTYKSFVKLPFLSAIGKSKIKRPLKNNAMIDRELTTACESIRLKNSLSQSDIIIATSAIGIYLGYGYCAMIDCCSNDGRLMKFHSCNKFSILNKFYVIEGEYKNVIMRRILDYTAHFEGIELNDEEDFIKKIGIAMFDENALMHCTRFVINKELGLLKQ